MNEFSEKVALITGASRGIGEATAYEFSRQGIIVLLIARSKDKLETIVEIIRSRGGRAESIICDVSSPKDVKRAVCLATGHYGRLDILVNNAGVIEPIRRLEDSDPDAWAETIDINLKGVYYGIRYAAPVMAEQGSGTIINISSGAATSALEGWSHYCASKAGVLSLTQCADKEFREKGVIVTGLSPGTVATDMQLAIRQSGINPVSRLTPDRHIPAAWAAQAVLWLCSPAAKHLAGSDFSLKSDDNRALVGLVPG